MNGKYLLDTNIVIDLFAQKTTVLNQLRQATEISIPSIVIGELRYGAYKSNRTSENLARIQQFVAQNIILNCDVDTSDWYGQIKDKLRRKGQPIPENDIWIAALALQYNLTLASRDKHFEYIEGLVIERW